MSKCPLQVQVACQSFKPSLKRRTVITLCSTLIYRWRCSSLANKKKWGTWLSACSVSRDPWESLRQLWPCLYDSHSTVLLKTLVPEFTVLPDVTNKDVFFAAVLCWWLSFGDCGIPMTVLSVARHFLSHRPAHYVNTLPISLQLLRSSYPTLPFWG